MIKPEKILKELTQLWVDLGHEERSGDNAPGADTGVLRACAMTLITIADETEDPSNIGETVARLMRDHPSRSVLIRLRTSGECLESRVFAQCWMPFGQRRQICCEQIEITAGGSSLDDVPGIVLPLTVPDLPVILWIRSPRLIESPGFPRIAAMSNKIVMDSAAFPNARQALETLRSNFTGPGLFADLAWARITRWRETVSQLFAGKELLGALPHVTHARIGYGTEYPRTEPIYLAAWLRNGLQQAGSSSTVELIHGEGPPIAFLELDGPGLNLRIQCERGGAVEVRANDLLNRLAFPEATDYTALAEELSITSRDPVFEAALAAAGSIS